MPRAAHVGMVLAVAFAVAVGGCTSTSKQNTASAPATIMRVSGSAACEPCLRLLTDTADIPNVEWWYLASPGSRSGVEGAASGELAIGTVSRLLTEDESKLGLKYVKLSDDGLVFALHPSVGITGFTAQQVRDIYTGVYTNWRELGGPDLPIVVLDRHDDEPAKAVMRKYVFGDDLVVTSRAAALYSETDMVKGVESTLGAIGYFSLGYAITNGVVADYPALDGVTPSVATIRSGQYEITRPLGIVTAEDPSPEVAAFLAWAESEQGRQLLEDNGYVAATPGSGQ